jgi:hypothetical protein
MDDRQIDCSDGTHYEYERRCDMNASMNTLDGLRIGSRHFFIILLALAYFPVKK